LPVTNPQQMQAAARKMHALGSQGVVVTGGHLEEAIDVLSVASEAGIQQRIFRSKRLPSSATHGTGCAFSTAIACRLARGENLQEAVFQAKNYVSAAIANAYPVGRGMGPLHHLHGMRATRNHAMQRRPRKRTSAS
jgi:hydroxymethylpyrimidine/phosphomethylpyrimidine kinase